MADSSFSRRALLRSVGALSIGAAAASAQTNRMPAASTPPPTQTAPPLQTTKLADHLLLVTGDGGNIAVVISEGGLLLVDGGFAERVPDLIKAIGGITALPIETMFDTHWHVDHVGANEAVGRRGGRIIAHENVRKRLSVKTTMESLNRTFEPLPLIGLPTITFTDGGKLYHGSTVLEFLRVAPAHTDGDAYVFLPNENVLHTGDLFFNGIYPVIDYSTGGWIGGMIAAADKLLTVGDAQTRIIPGHGPMTTRAELKASRDMLETIYTRLQPMAQKGMTADAVVAAAPTRDLDARWGQGFIKGPMFARLAYTSILRHNQQR